MCFGGLIAGLLAGPAVAEDGEPSPDPVRLDIDVSGPGEQVPEHLQQQADAKYRIAVAYRKARNGTGSFRAVEQAAADYEARYGPQLSADGVRSANGKPTALTNLTASGGQRILNVAHTAQNENHYCGPASGKMILAHLGAGRSKYDNSWQWQVNIANDNHMATDDHGATKWSLGRFRIGLNRWREGKIAGYYLDKDSPSGAYMKDALRYDIDRGYPFGADTVEWYNRSHYNHHPNLRDPIGHWLVARGYSNYGNRVYFADPSTSVWGHLGTKRYFNRNTHWFTDTFLQSNGITW